MNLKAEVSRGELAYSPKVLEVCMSELIACTCLITFFFQDEFGEAEQDVIAKEAVEKQAREREAKERMLQEPKVSKKRKPKKSREVQIEAQ